MRDVVQRHDLVIVPHLRTSTPPFRAQSSEVPRRLFLYERQEPHEAGALHGGFDGALLLRSQTALAAAHDSSMRVNELLQKVYVFVVDVTDIVLCEDVVGHVRDS